VPGAAASVGLNPLAPLDRMVEIVPGRSGRAIRDVPLQWSLFDSHFPRFPVLPGVLLVGGLAELSAQVLGGPGRWRLTRLSRVRFRHYVRPGDTVDLIAEVTEAGDDEATVRCRAEVAGQPVATITTMTLRRTLA
jgi:3-hydroxyacyl-[acyl-carrier-protein] dehydratase